MDVLVQKILNLTIDLEIPIGQDYHHHHHHHLTIIIIIIIIIILKCNRKPKIDSAAGSGLRLNEVRL